MYKDINPIGLRLPGDLRAKVQQSATENHRSMNAELVARVQESYEKASRLEDFDDGQLVQELIRRWGRDSVYIQLGRKTSGDNP